MLDTAVTDKHKYVKILCSRWQDIKEQSSNEQDTLSSFEYLPHIPASLCFVCDICGLSSGNMEYRSCWVNENINILATFHLETTVLYF